MINVPEREVKRRPLATAEQVAELLNAPKSSVFEMGRHGTVPGVVRVGRRLRFDLDKLEPWLESGGNK